MAGSGAMGMSLMIIGSFMWAPGLFFFSWERLLVAVVRYALAINVGVREVLITRLLTHRGASGAQTAGICDGLRCALCFLRRLILVSTTACITNSATRKAIRTRRAKAAAGARAGTASHCMRRPIRDSPDLGRDRFHVWLSKYHSAPAAEVSAPPRMDLGRLVQWESPRYGERVGLHATWL